MTSRNALKAHLGASFQTFHRLRDELLDPLEQGDRQTLGPSLLAIQKALEAEYRWLQERRTELGDGTHRGQFLSRYAVQVVAVMGALNVGVKSSEPQAFEPFGKGLLTLLALGPAMRAL